MKPGTTFTKRTPFLILLLLISSSVGAQWLKVYEKDAGSIYVDEFTMFHQLTIQKDKGLPIVWILHNYDSRNPFGDLSSIERIEFNCKEEHYRRLSFTQYAERMAEGKSTKSMSPTLDLISEWFPISSTNLLRPVFQLVCVKK